MDTTDSMARYPSLSDISHTAYLILAVYTRIIPGTCWYATHRTTSSKQYNTGSQSSQYMSFCPGTKS